MEIRRRKKKTLALWSVVGAMVILALMAGMTGVIGMGEGDAKADFVPGEVIVGFSTRIHAQESVISAYGGNVVDRIDALNCVLVKVKSGDEQAFMSSILEEPNVRYAEPNRIVKALYVPDDPRYGEQWGPRRVNANDAWNIETGAKDVKIAIVDSGVDYTHEDLSANYVSGGYDWINGDNDPMDDYGHGTHCAGIAAAVMDNGKGIAGIAQVEIMAEKVLDETGSGDVWDVSQGIEHASDQGADIISMSFGPEEYPYPPSPEMLKSACNYAWEKGSLLIASAGNNNVPTVSWPGCFDTVTAVGAINEAGEKSSYSNYGDGVELAAPGDNILSTTLMDNYDYKSGTSMAAPHVTGVAALVWSMYPDLTNQKVRERLHLVSTYYDWTEYGLVDAKNALEDYVQISSINVSEEEVAKVQISIGNSENITGVSLNLSYNSFVVTIQNITANETINQTGNCTCDSNTTNGLARIAFLSAYPITTASETSIIDIELKAVGSGDSSSYLNLSSVYFSNTSYVPYTPSEVYNGTVNVTAVTTYNLTISSTVGGNVTVPGEGTFTYVDGEVVDLKAVPDAGYMFVNWTDEVGTITDVNANETTITMLDNYSITANFELEVATTGDININEIMYAPSEDWGGRYNEWVELYNNESTKAIEITGWTIDEKTIPEAIMQPGDYLIIARMKDTFDAYYPNMTCMVLEVKISLSNSGETIMLNDSMGNINDSVSYTEYACDGLGWGCKDNKTLEQNRTGGWQESRVEGGTPCKVNSVCYPTVTVRYPNGGEVITIGEVVNVSATATDDVGVENVTFYYSENNGTSWTEIGNGSIVPPGTAKSGTWNITWDTTGLTAETNYSIRANATDGMLTAEDESNSTFTLKKGMYSITGTTREANCSLEPNVTVTLYNRTTGSAVAETTSDETGNYSIAVPSIGNYSVNASKEEFKNETQNIIITETENTLNFSRDYGLTPEDPEMPYALECVNHWLYPNEQPEECRLSMSKALEVVNAWLY